MIQLTLTEEERDVLRDVLEGSLSDLRTEIAHTERLSLREALKARRAVILKAITALENPTPAMPANSL